MINSVLMMSEYYVLRQFTFLGVRAQHSHLKDCYMIDIIFLVFLNVNIILIVDIGRFLFFVVSSFFQFLLLTSTGTFSLKNCHRMSCRISAFPMRKNMSSRQPVSCRLDHQAALSSRGPCLSTTQVDRRN